MQKMNEDIPYIAHEAAQARLERVIKRMWVIIVLLIVLLVGSNSLWIYYESQWEVTETTVESTVERGVAIANGDGSVNYYGSESKSDSTKTNP